MISGLNSIIGDIAEQHGDGVLKHETRAILSSRKRLRVMLVVP